MKHETTGESLAWIVEAGKALGDAQELDRATCERLGIDVTQWAAEIRERVSHAVMHAKLTKPQYDLLRRMSEEGYGDVDIADLDVAEQLHTHPIGKLVKLYAAISEEKGEHTTYKVTDLGVALARGTKTANRGGE